MRTEHCRHLRFERLGVQKFPFAPYRVYLLRCAACGDTLTTRTVKERRGPGAEAPPVAQQFEP